MLSQQNLIYLGIALLVVGIAFFAYQELQKHHTEIEKLRMQSQKLQKIIHAYNMGQWHQSEYRSGDRDEEENESEDESEDETEDQSDSEDERESDREHKMVHSFLQNTLQSMGGASVGTPSRVTVSAGGKTLQFPVVTPLDARTPYNYRRISSEEDYDDLPNVETFDGVFNRGQAVKHPLLSQEEGGDKSDESDENDNNDDNDDNDEQDEEESKEKGNTFLEEMEQHDVSEVQNEKKEPDFFKGGNEKVKEICKMPLLTGDRKGEPCGNAAKINGMCLRHFRSENK